eukprot:1012075-Heterocapsa_arctica.AAC.1
MRGPIPEPGEETSIIRRPGELNHLGGPFKDSRPTSNPIHVSLANTNKVRKLKGEPEVLKSAKNPFPKRVSGRG